MTVDTLDSPATIAGKVQAVVRRPRLAIGGWVRHPLLLDAQTLDAMEWTLVNDFDVVCTLDGSHGVLKPVRTVRLCDLVDQARPAFEKRTDFKRVAIVAEGEEGYRALFVIVRPTPLLRRGEGMFSI